MVRVIPVTQGFHALVDDEDFDRVNQWSWTVKRSKRTVYAQGLANGQRLFLHRFILNAPSGVEVDHINGDGLDNRRSNLRLATVSQNQANRKRLNANNTTGYRGVTYNKGNRRWLAQIQHEGIQMHLGYFTTPEEAARAYDQKAEELFGEFAKTNHPQNSEAVQKRLTRFAERVKSRQSMN
jgi:hypothetical protein